MSKSNTILTYLLQIGARIIHYEGCVVCDKHRGFCDLQSPRMGHIDV